MSLPCAYSYTCYDIYVYLLCASTYLLQSNLRLKNKCFHNIPYSLPIWIKITMGFMSNKMENKQIQRRRTVLNCYRKVVETGKVGKRYDV